MNFQTKPEICEYMVSLLPPDTHTVLEPTPGEGNLVKAIIAVGLHVTAPDDFWRLYGFKFDAIVMNPPFTPMRQGYDILFKCMEMSQVIIALMPWLTIINSEKRTRRLYEFGLKAVTHLPRSAFPGARVQTCILQLLKGYEGPTELKYYK